jgi:hypothetical protein
MKRTKLSKLVSFLRTQARTGKTVNLKKIQNRWPLDESMVVYFNGLRRNGAISSTGRVFVSKLDKALALFRNRNAVVQKQHYERNGNSFGGYTGSPFGNSITEL